MEVIKMACNSKHIPASLRKITSNFIVELSEKIIKSSENQLPHESLLSTVSTIELSTTKEYIFLICYRKMRILKANSPVYLRIETDAWKNIRRTNYHYNTFLFECANNRTIVSQADYNLVAERLFVSYKSHLKSTRDKSHAHSSSVDTCTNNISIVPLATPGLIGDPRFSLFASHFKC